MKGSGEQVGGGPFVGKWNYCDDREEKNCDGEARLSSIFTTNCPAKYSDGVSRRI